MHDDGVNNTKHARRTPQRWLRFSIRTLLVVVAALCVWLGLRVNAARRQREAVVAIHNLGGKVYYDYQVQRSPRGHDEVDPKTPFPFPAWLRPIAEEVFPPKVVTVTLRDTNTTDSDLALLGSLPYVNNLDLSNTKVTDKGMEAVGRLTRLHSLVLIGLQVGDHGVSQIKHLRLEVLSLWKTNVSDAGVHDLRDMTTLRNLSLDETRITDAALEDVGQLSNLDVWLGLAQTQVTDAGAAHLAHLKKLKHLNLIGTSVSKEGRRRLRQSLPEADVSAGREVRE